MGIFLFISAILLYIKMNSPTGLGIVGWVLKYTISVFLLITYIVITLLFKLIRFLKNSKKQK